MRYAGIDEATPELAAHDARWPASRWPAWLGDLTTTIGVAVAVGAAALGVVLWLARSERRDAARAGGRFNIVRCPVHGIAYDAELEECTECAKTGPGGVERQRHLAAVPPAATPTSPSLRPLPKSVE